MENSKNLLKEAKIFPKLRLMRKSSAGTVSTGPHIVKLIKDKIDTVTDIQTGKQVEAVTYLLEEDGVQKTYTVKKLDKKGELSYFIRLMAEFPSGSVVSMEAKKAGIKNYIEILSTTRGDVEIDDEAED